MNKTLREKSKHRAFSGPYCPGFGLNMERYSVSLSIQSKCGKIWTRTNLVFGHFSHNETLSKEIMEKSKLRNKYLKSRNVEDR